MNVETTSQEFWTPCELAGYSLSIQVALNDKFLTLENLLCADKDVLRFISNCKRLRCKISCPESTPGPKEFLSFEADFEIQDQESEAARVASPPLRLKPGSITQLLLNDAISKVEISVRVQSK